MEVNPSRLLTPDEQQHFMALEAMFNSPGWTIISRQLAEEIEGQPERLFWSVTSYDELVAERIKIAERVILLRYPDLVERQKEDLIRTREADVQDAVEGLYSNE